MRDVQQRSELDRGAPHTAVRLARVEVEAVGAPFVDEAADGGQRRLGVLKPVA
jgi:hypothetical protein